MSTGRREFPAKVKLAAWERSRGQCERCTARIYGDPQYDHIVPDAVGGANDLDNCQVLCRACHGVKTSKTDVPEIAKTKRVQKKRAGIKTPKSRPLPGTKASGWRKRMDGTAERRG